MAFKYKERSKETLEKRAAATSEFAGVLLTEFKEYTVRDGDNYIRFLPPTWTRPEPTHYGLDIYTHWGVGPDRTSIICLYKMAELAQHLDLPAFADGICPICQARAAFDKAGKKEESDELRWSKRVLTWIIDLKDREAGPQMFLMAPSLDQQICQLAIDPRTGETMIVDHPYDGFGVTFNKSGKQLSTRYNGVRIDTKMSSVPDDVLDFIDATPLTSQLLWRDYGTVKKLFGGDAGAGAEVRERERASAREEPRERERSRDREPEPEPEREREPAPRERERTREREPEPEREREPAPRERTREREPEPEREEPRTRERTTREPEPERDEPAPRSRTRSEPEDERQREPSLDPDDERPRSTGRRDDPPFEEPAKASGGKSAADLMREKFKRK